jgi:hypothetical protein
MILFHKRLKMIDGSQLRAEHLGQVNAEIMSEAPEGSTRTEICVESLIMSLVNCGCIYVQNVSQALTC